MQLFSIPFFLWFIGSEHQLTSGLQQVMNSMLEPNTQLCTHMVSVFPVLSPWGTIALAKCLESKYWHLPVKSSGPQIHREKGASWRDGKRARMLKKESKKETCVKLFPQTSWNWSQDATVTTWTSWEPYFRLHTITSRVYEALLWQHLVESLDSLEYVQIL